MRRLEASERELEEAREDEEALRKRRSDEVIARKTNEAEEEERNLRLNRTIDDRPSREGALKDRGKPLRLPPLYDYRAHRSFLFSAVRMNHMFFSRLSAHP